jgi:hypothetical protein
MSAEWWREIQVGDEVCDCRFNHIKVVEIHKEYIRRPYFFFYKYTPSNMPDWLDDLLWWAQGLFPSREVWNDSTFVLGDGYRCSAVYCCDPVSHTEEHL